MAAPLGDVVLVEFQIEKSVVPLGGARDDIPPLAAVAAVRAALRDVLLPPEADAPAPVSAFIDFASSNNS